MSTDLYKTHNVHTPAVKTPDERPPLSDAAKRALAEADERRKAREAEEAALPREYHGRGGLDPARYGDWEAKGIAIDF